MTSFPQAHELLAWLDAMALKSPIIKVEDVKKRVRYMQTGKDAYRRVWE